MSRYLSPPIIEPTSLPKIMPESTITDETQIQLYTVTAECDIYFTADGSEPDPFMTTSMSTRQTHRYTGPFYLSPGFITIRAVTMSRDGRWRSSVSTRGFYVQSRYSRGTGYLDIDRATTRLADYTLDTYQSPRLTARDILMSKSIDYPARYQPRRDYLTDYEFNQYSDQLNTQVDDIDYRFSKLNPFTEMRDRIRYSKEYPLVDTDFKRPRYNYDHGFEHKYNDNMSLPQRGSRGLFDDDLSYARWKSSDVPFLDMEYMPHSPRKGNRSTTARARRYKPITYFDPKSY